MLINQVVDAKQHRHATPDMASLTTPHCMVLLPGEFNGRITAPLAVHDNNCNCCLVILPSYKKLTDIVSELVGV